MTPIEAAREAACAAPDTMGRVHPSITHAAIRAGAWDQGELVQGKLRELASSREDG